ncbi:MAG: YceI family protein [Chloroflexota bacterium]
MRKITIIFTALLLFNFLLASFSPAQVLAHDGDIQAVDGVTAPPPPELPRPTGQQTLYRIDPNQSVARYSVQEVYVGTIDGKLVVGETTAINGEGLVDWENPANSQLGMITVNIEQLTSDSKQRDRQIRKSYLESSLYPEATFIPQAEQDFPDAIAVGEPISFVLHGFLTVRETTIQSDWTVELTLEADRMVGRATTDILMSDFGVGPISIVGLLSTEDEMQLSLDFVALPDGTASPVTAPPLNAGSVEPIESDLVFSDIRPIVEAKCVACHVDGEIGHTLFPMETVGDVVEYADDLALMIQTGFMPPWSPSHEAPAFKMDRSLSEAEKAQLIEWIAAGAPSDVPLDEPLEDRSPLGVTLREDIILTMPEPYVPAGDISDDYRCFMLDPQLPNGGFVTGSEVIPGDKRVVHHVILFQGEPGTEVEAAALAAEDDRLGWECFGGPGLSTSSPGAIGNSVGTWVPGSGATTTASGSGIYVPPGGLVVMQVHYNYEAGFYPDQTSAVLQVESADSGLTPLLGIPLLAPVEIPCPVESENPACERDVSLSEKPEVDQELAEILFMFCNKDELDYVDSTAENAVSSCDWRVPVDGEMVSSTPHMHTRGVSIRVTLNPDGASPIIMQDIPIWDFNWQGTYDYLEPIPVKEGDVLRVTCTWDNTNESNTKESKTSDFRYMTWGEGTNDEMCLNVATFKPADGFIELEGGALFVNSLGIYPNWLPTWGRIGMLRLAMLPGAVQVLLWAVLLALLAAAFVFVRGGSLREIFRQLAAVNRRDS